MQQILQVLKTRIFGGRKKAVPQSERRRRSRDRGAPTVGDYVAHRKLKMRVTPTRTDELWKWLLQEGWRVVRYEGDRRKYLVLPDEVYTRLDLASSSERPMLLRALQRQKG